MDSTVKNGCWIGKWQERGKPKERMEFQFVIRYVFPEACRLRDKWVHR